MAYEGWAHVGFGIWGRTPVAVAVVASRRHQFDLVAAADAAAAVLKL